MVATGSYKPEIYKREEWELKQLREKTMKQNWGKEDNTLHAILAGLLLSGFIQGSENEKLNDSVLGFAKKEMKKLIHQAKQEERERILKELPEEKVGEPSWDGKSGTFGAFNDCLKQIKDIIK